MEARKLRACGVLIWILAMCGCSGQAYQRSALQPDLVLIGRVESVERKPYFDWDTWDAVNVVSFRYGDQRDGLIRFVLPDRMGVSGCATENSEQLYIAFLKKFSRSEPELKEFRYYTWTCLPIDPSVASMMKSELMHRD